jgi:serine/threonine protein kinase
MCTGRPAFRAGSAVAVLRRVCDDTPRPIREIHAQVPDWLVSIIDRLLAKKPQDRHQSAGKVEDLLNQCLAWSQQGDLASIKRFP